VTSAKDDAVDIEFVTIPEDMDAFVRDLYEFCPDIVDQGAGCVADMVEAMEEAGEELPDAMKMLIEGIDFEDEDFGLEIVKRTLQIDKSITLWWD
jgi:hypothetical protein